MGFFDSILKGIASGFRTLIGGFKSVAETTYDIGAKVIQTAKINFDY